jgi:hypothetical protein
MIWDYSTGIGVVTQFLFWGMMVILAIEPVRMVAIPHEVWYVNPTLAILHRRYARSALTHAEYEHALEGMVR